jgi:hypothetical protein
VHWGRLLDGGDVFPGVLLQQLKVEGKELLSV